MSPFFFGQKQVYVCKSNLGTFYWHIEKDVSKNEFTAETNPKLIFNNLSFFKRILAKNKIQGSILKVKEGKINGDSLSGKVTTRWYRNLYFKAKKTKNGNLEGGFYSKSLNIDFIATPVKDDKKPLKNYQEEYEKIMGLIKDNIYNPMILREKEWRQFNKNLKKTYNKSKDDLDAFVSFRMQKSKLKTSHVYIFPKLKMEKEHRSQFKFSKIDERTSKLQFDGFSLQDVDSINHCLSNIKTQNLIIDLRDCSGGDFSSILLASHFIKEEKYVGYFLGNKYYQTTQNLPTKEQLSLLKPFEGKTISDIHKAVETEGIVLAKAKPTLPFYGGKIWVLTNEDTASACEPFVEFMKTNKLATIVGEKTSGAMLSAKAFDINENYELYLPIGNYYTIDNFWIEQNGVKPDIETKSDEAEKKVLELISK